MYSLKQISEITNCPLEGAGSLQRLELEPRLAAGRLGQAVGADQWRAADVGDDAASSRLDVSK